MPIIGETISEDNSFLFAETVEAREIIKARMGQFKPAGGITMFPEPENMGLLLKSLFGTVADGGVASAQQAATTTYKHTFKPTNNGPRSYTLEVGSDVTAGARKYTSALTKKMELSAVAGEFLQASFDFDAQTVALEALDTASFSALDPFVYSEAYGKIAGSEDANIEAFKVTIENMWADRPTLNSRFPAGKAIEGVKVSGSIDINFTALTNYMRFLGSSSSTSPEAQTYTPHALALHTDGIATGDATYVYELNVLMPECVFKTNKANLDKRSRMMQNVTFEAIYNASSAYVVAVELQNKVESYPDAA